MTSNSRVSFQEICEYPVLENLHRACVHIIGHFFLFFFLLCSRNWLLVVTVGWCLFCFRFSEEKKKAYSIHFGGTSDLKYCTSLAYVEDFRVVLSLWKPILQSVVISRCSRFVFAFRATVVLNNLLLNSSALIPFGLGKLFICVVTSRLVSTRIVGRFHCLKK